MKLAAIKTEEEKALMERRAREAELIAARIVEDCERRARESEQLRSELLAARLSERAAKEKLQQLIEATSYASMQGIPYVGDYSAGEVAAVTDYSNLRLEPDVGVGLDPRGEGRLDMGDGVGVGVGVGEIDYSGDLAGGDILVDESSMDQSELRVDENLDESMLPTADMDQLSKEIEKERVEYMEKSKHLHKQLQELKSEIEVLKVEDKTTDLDKLHEENVKRGDNKYQTLQKIKAGTTKSRVAFFEEL